MRAGALLFVSVAACAPGSSFLQVPSGVDYVAWIELGEGGQVLDTSRLFAVGDAEVWAIGDERQVVFVGYAAAQAEVVDTARLEATGDCAPQLPPPPWAYAKDGAPAESLPRLSASTVVSACQGAAEVQGVICAPCAGVRELEVYTAEIDDLHHNLRSVTLVPERGVMISAPPDELAFFLIDAGGLATAPPRIGEMLRPPFPIDRTATLYGGDAYAPTTDGAVLAMNLLQPPLRIEIGHPDLRVVSNMSVGLIVFGLDGPAMQIVDQSTTAIARPELREHIADLALGREEAAVLTAERIYAVSPAATTTVSLPPGFPPIDPANPDGAHIGYYGRDLVVGAPGTDVFRYSRSQRTWAPLGWPTSGAAQPRAFAEVGDSLLVGGHGTDEGGLLMAFNDRGQWRAPVRSPVNALAGGPGSPLAYAVTSGSLGLLLVEVRAP